MKDKFYKLLVDCYNKKSTCLYPNPPLTRTCCEDGDNHSATYLEGIHIYFPEDDDAAYLPMHTCLKIGSNVVSRQFKEVVEPYIVDKSNVEFIPVRVIQKKYGERPYYIMHFLEFQDVIDYDHSKIVSHPDGTETVMVPSLQLSLIKDLHLFSINAIGSTIISDVLKKALVKNGMKEGLTFSKVCVRDKE